MHSSYPCEEKQVTSASLNALADTISIPPKYEFSLRIIRGTFLILVFLFKK